MAKNRALKVVRWCHYKHCHGHDHHITTFNAVLIHLLKVFLSGHFGALLLTKKVVTIIFTIALPSVQAVRMYQYEIFSQ